jgi:Subtilase family
VSISVFLLFAFLAAVTAGSAVAGQHRSKGVPAERNCPHPKPGYYECMSLHEPRAGSPGSAFLPNFEGSGEEGAFSPADLRSAYHLPTSGGSGQTVAIVDAFDDPNAEADLKTYRSHYGLSECTKANGCFKKVDGSGLEETYPEAEPGWASEISLDLDMVSATCPECHIVLVEAFSNQVAALQKAENTAATAEWLKTTVISNSWSGEERSSETSEESAFHHPGIPIVFSAGDVGAQVDFPTASQYVIAVGGTLLKKSANYRGWTESVWEGTGAGCSAYEPKPAWQHDLGCSRRTVNDVSAVASCASPVSVYDSYFRPGWQRQCGTSASAPIVAALEGLSTPEARSAGAEFFWSQIGPLGKLFDPIVHDRRGLRQEHWHLWRRAAELADGCGARLERRSMGERLRRSFRKSPDRRVQPGRHVHARVRDGRIGRRAAR